MQLQVVEGSINDGPLLRQLLSAGAFTHVLHLAARAGVRDSTRDAEGFIHTNISGTATLLQAMCSVHSTNSCCSRGCVNAGTCSATDGDRGCRSSGICTFLPLPHLVYASSSSVYGEACGPQGPLREDTDLQPISVYAFTKESTERLVQVRKATHVKGCNCCSSVFEKACNGPGCFRRAEGGDGCVAVQAWVQGGRVGHEAESCGGGGMSTWGTMWGREYRGDHAGVGLC